VATTAGPSSRANDVVDLAKRFQDYGVEAVIHTDIGRDGMLKGVNVEATVEARAGPHHPVIASGGLTSLDDVRRLCEVESEGIVGAITGRAIYEGAPGFRAAQKLPTAGLTGPSAPYPLERD